MTVAAPKKSLHADLHATLPAMVAIQVRDVPEGIRDDLARAAQQRGLSLQAFLRDVLEREARSARNREFVRAFAPIRGTSQHGLPDVVSIIAAERSERDHTLARPDTSAVTE